MPTIISGSTGISGTDGTAATPAVQGTDTNTGIFFPAADTIAFAEGGTEVMRIDSSGRVGIGTTAPSERLQVGDSTDIGNIRIRALTGLGGRPGFSLVRTSQEEWLIRTHPTGALVFEINDAERARITGTGDFQFNSGYGSSAVAYGCRAWVNFNGTGTVAIRASGNVSSITDNNTGDYSVNFTNAMPDTNYCVSINGRISAGSLGVLLANANAFASNGTGFCRMTIGVDNNNFGDGDFVFVAVFR